MTNAPPKVYAGIDWLTLTTGPNGPGQVAYSAARALAVEQQEAGNQLRPWGAHGYRGFAIQHLRAARNANETLIELSGPLADRYWREFLPLAANVSRIDPHVTVTFSHDVRDLAINAYEAAPVTIRQGLKPIRKTLYVGTDGGQTCYLGAPTSSRRARLYDKHRESPRDYPPNTWRYELQVRSPMGSGTAGLIDGSDDVHRSVSALVHNYFCAHGIVPWFHADGAVVFRPTRVPSSDLSKWLDWLRSGVRPGVRKRLNVQTRDAITAALGLAEEENDADDLRTILREQPN